MITYASYLPSIVTEAEENICYQGALIYINLHMVCTLFSFSFTVFEKWTMNLHVI